MPAIVPAHPAESSMGWSRSTSKAGDVRSAAQYHRTQPSLDTIGSCSLDVQATTATSPTGADLIDGSEGTLRSISFDQHKALVREPSRSGRGSVRSPPSYLSIACAVSGYSSINRYDSAVREGFRSRDNSPAPPRLVFARSRDSSPLGSRLKSPESKCTPQETALRIKELKAQLARCAQELGGQLDDRSRQGSIRRRDKKPPSGRSVSVDRGYLTKASLINTGASQGYREDRLRYLDSSPRHTEGDGARNGYSSGNMTSHQVPVRLIETQQKFNGHLHTPLTTLHSRAIDNTIEETRSFIQERIERLYGPGALAAGFIRRTPSHGDSSSVTSGMGNAFRRPPGGVQRSGEGRIIPIQLEYDETDNSQGLPSVFRHLRPEFRHQLPVKSPVSSASKATISKRTDTAEVNGHAVSAAGVTSHGSSPARLAASAVPTPLEAITRGPDSSAQSNGRHGDDTTDAATKLSCSMTSVADDTPSCCGVLTSAAASAPHNGCSSSIPRNKVVPSAEQTTAVTAAVGADGSSTTTSGEVVKDGHYYLKVVAAEVSSLEVEVAELDAELEQHSAAMTEDLRGKVFAASGKTKLLISQKIKQFTGLCHKNIAGQQGTDEFPTTDMDLAGFWDMVSLQVVDVRGLLQQLRVVRDNGWKEVSASPVPAPTSVKPRRVKAVAAPVDKAKEEARKKAAEDRRKALREAMKAKRAAAAAEGGGDSEEVAIFVPES